MTRMSAKIDRPCNITKSHIPLLARTKNVKDFCNNFNVVLMGPIYFYVDLSHLIFCKSMEEKSCKSFFHMPVRCQMRDKV